MLKPIVCRCLAAVLGLTLVGWPGESFAGGLKISQIYLELSSSKRLDAITLENSGRNTIALHVQAKAWSHPDGENKLEKTRDILVNPAIFELAPGQSQILRLGLQSQPTETERPFRLVIQELPYQQSGIPKQIKTMLRVTLPVFVSPTVEGKPELLWTLEKGENGRLYARVTNLGNTHAEVSNINIAQQSGISVKKVGPNTYVLPGQYRQWELPDQLDTTRPLVLEADGKHGKIQSAIAFSEAGSVVEAMQ
jgi:fimbrial chaperone protein